MKLIYCAFLFVAHVSSEETSCREGWYGVDCGLQCSYTCRPLETFPCNKETGKCSEGCKRGFYGPQCERNCSCVGPCIQDTGDCIGEQTQTTVPTPQPCPEKSIMESNLWLIAAAVFIFLFALLAVIFLSYVCFKRRTSRRPKQSVDAFDMANAGEPLMDSYKNDKLGTKTKPRKNKIVEQQLHDANEKIKKLEKKQKKLVEEHNTTFKNFGLCQDSSYHLLREKKLKRSAFLQCTWLILDPEIMNMTATNLDAYGKMSNKPDTRPQHEGGLSLYLGTTTTVPLQATGSAQYWEVKSNIAVKEAIQENETLLDFGFCLEEDRDKDRFTPARKPCCTIKVENCSVHKQLCLKVFSDKKSNCYQQKAINTDNAKGSTVSFDLGFLLYESADKITFFDLEILQPIHTISLDFDKIPFWPMFGLGAEMSTDTNITLVSGNDISMNDDKILMIKKDVKTFMERF